MLDDNDEYQLAYISLGDNVLFMRKECGYSDEVILIKVRDWCNIAFTSKAVAEAKATVLAELQAGSV